MNSGGNTALTVSASALAVAVDGLLDADLTPHLDTEFIAVMREVESSLRKLEAVKHRLTVETGTRCLAARAGASTPIKFLEQTLRLSHADATARWNAAQLLAPRVFPTGELEPVLPYVAEAQRAGEISADHARHIMAIMHRLPDSLPDRKKEAAQQILTDYACNGFPDTLPRLGNEIMMRVNPDGELAADRDRQRLRGLTIGRQRVNGMSPVSGELTPTLRAVLDPLLAKLARPGMCNPEDPDSPCTTTQATDRTVLAAAAKRDTRSAAQRNHDALLAFLRFECDPTILGTHRGLPVTALLSMSVADVERGTGIATTATGGTLSVSEALKLATTAQDSSTFVAVLDQVGAPVHVARVRRTPGNRARGKGAAKNPTPGIGSVGKCSAGATPGFTLTDLPLHVGHDDRLATKAQRLALIAAEKGCTRPDCSAPASLSAVHHITEWAKE
ncbi:DUF222 domain-containing protein, partial [Nocardia sp. SYP-A9097]|uniref:DUF222 domain-containing protein n=1 Tax=Nocardia sp. SYP-A9097 TaxID=2663237 RepID=UPI00129BD2A4